MNGATIQDRTLYRETIESRHDGECHRQRDRGRCLSVLAYDLAQRGLQTVSQQAIPAVYGTIRIDIGFRAGLIVEYAPDGTLLTITGSYTGVDIPKDGASCSAEKMGRRFSSPAERRSIVGA